MTSKRRTSNAQFPTYDELYSGEWEQSFYPPNKSKKEVGRLQRIARKLAAPLLAATILTGVGVGIAAADKAGMFKTEPGTAVEYSPADEAKLATIIKPKMSALDSKVLAFDAQHPGVLTKQPGKHAGDVELSGTLSKDGNDRQIDVVMGTDATGTPNPNDPRYIMLSSNTKVTSASDNKTMEVLNIKQFVAPGGEDYTDGTSLANEENHSGTYGGWSAASSHIVTWNGSLDVVLSGSIDTSAESAFAQNPTDPYGPTDKFMTANAAVSNAGDQLDALLTEFGQPR